MVRRSKYSMKDSLATSGEKTTVAFGGACDQVVLQVYVSDRLK